MKKYRLFFYFLFFLFLMSCTDAKNKEDFLVKNINIDIKQIENIKSDYFLDSVKYVKLETNADNLIRGIKKIIYSNDMFYILDNSMNSIYIFDKQGKFIYNINHQGPGPQEYIGINDFVLLDSIITFVDMDSQNIVSYKLGNGSFFNKKKFSYYIRNIVALPNKNYLGFDVNTGAIIMDSTFNMEKKILRYFNEIPLPGNDVGYIYKMKDSCGIFSPYDNTIYHIKDEFVQKKYIFKYIGMKTPSDYRLGEKLSYDQALAKMEKKGITVVVHRETDNWIFQILVLQKNNVLIYALYSKKSDKMTIIGNIDNFKNVWFNSFSFCEMDNCLIQAATLPIEELKRQIKNTPEKYTSDFIEIVRNSKEDDNPVLQLLYLKK